MDALLQIRNFQNLLRRELDWKDRARVSAVCKASRDALCDPEALRAHMERIMQSIEDLRCTLEEEESLEGDLNDRVNEYFEDALPIEARRIEAFLRLPTKDFHYTVRMAILLIAFSLDFPEYTKYLKKLHQDQMSGNYSVDMEALDALAEGFLRSGIAFAMWNVENLVGHIIVRDLTPSHRMHSPENDNFFWHDSYATLEAMASLLENQFRAGVYENLGPMLERARQYVFYPFEKFQAASMTVLDKTRQIAEDIRSIGVPRLTRRWDFMVRQLSRSTAVRGTVGIGPSLDKFERDVRKLSKRQSRRTK